MQKILIVIGILWCFYGSSQLTVEGVYPVPQSMYSFTETPIIITFSDIIDESTITNSSFQVFGRWSGPMSGAFGLGGNGNIITFDPDRAFFAGEWITVTMSSLIESNSGDCLENGYQYNYWIKSEPGMLDLGEPQVIEMREFGEGWIQCYGAYAGDINDDDLSDLSVINEISEDVRILVNDENTGYSDFSIASIPGSNKPSTNEGADFNQDGFIDIAIGSTQSHTVTLLYGNGAGFENETSLIADVGVRGLSVLDFNGDGLMDIATANRNGSNIALLENLGLEFSDANLINLPCNGETAMAAGDFNEDGLLDLAVGCHFSGDISIVINNYGAFELSDSEIVNSQPWMVAVGDLNGDSHLDVASANSGSATISILMGDGLGGLDAPVNYVVGNFPLAIDLGDLDGDGDLDVISSNYQSSDFTLYENDGNGNLIDPINYSAQQAGSCAIFHDNNSDGVLDLTLIDELVDEVYIHTNTAVVGMEDLTQNLFSIHPNPSNGEIYVSGKHQDDNLLILDSKGRTIGSITGDGKFDLTDYASGQYLIRSALFGHTQKLIIEQ